MRRLIACLCLIVLSASVPTARASHPSAANSSLPPGLQLVGMTGGVPDPFGEAVVTVRDDGNNPVPNAQVELLFGACYSDPNQDLWISATQPFPGMSVTCNGAGTIVSAWTDEHGRAVFRILGSAQSTQAGLWTSCVTVQENGRVLGTLRLGAYDLDGANGVNAADMGLLLRVLFAGPSGYRTRADLNGDGICNSADLSKLLKATFGAGSLQSGPARCPD